MDAKASEGLLSRYTLVDTCCPEEARHEIGQIFVPHFLAPRDRSATGFHAIHRSARQDFFSLNVVRYGCEVDIDPGELSGFFLLLFAIDGTGSVRCGNDTAQISPNHTAAVLSPTLPTRMLWSADCETIAVLLDRGAMEKQWAMMTDRPVSPVQFSTAVDLRAAAGNLLLSHVRLMLEGMEADDISTPYRTRLAESLMQLVLSSFAHSQRFRLEQSTASNETLAVRRAEDWIRANISRSFSADEVATASGFTSLRALQNTLRRNRDATLTEMIELIRLQAFHTCLTSRDGQHSVTDCALSAGLGHLGRAAIAYRKRYGETPSQTLRRRR